MLPSAQQRKVKINPKHSTGTKVHLRSHKQGRKKRHFSHLRDKLWGDRSAPAPAPAALSACAHLAPPAPGPGQRRGGPGAAAPSARHGARRARPRPWGAAAEPAGPAPPSRAGAAPRLPPLAPPAHRHPRLPPRHPRTEISPRCRRAAPSPPPAQRRRSAACWPPAASPATHAQPPRSRGAARGPRGPARPPSPPAPSAARCRRAGRRSASQAAPVSSRGGDGGGRRYVPGPLAQPCGSQCRQRPRRCRPAGREAVGLSPRVQLCAGKVCAAVTAGAEQQRENASWEQTASWDGDWHRRVSPAHQGDFPVHVFSK